MRSKWRQIRGWNVTAATLTVLVVLAVGGGGTAFAKGTHRTPSLSLQLNSPTGIAASGGALYVSNGASNSVTEVNASDGTRLATISARRFGLNGPTAVLAVGSDIFVANGAGNSVTEIKVGNNRRVRIIRGPRYDFHDPVALASSGNTLYILSATGVVTEVATGTGRRVGVASGSQYGFATPTGLVVADGLVFVANSAANSVTVLNATTLAETAILSDPSFGFNTPIGLAFDGTDIWVTNQGGDSVTELSPATLQAVTVLVSGYLPMVGPVTFGDGYVFTLSPPGSSPMVSQIVPSPASVTWMMCNTNGPYLFDNPESLALSGSNLWVANESGNSLTEMDSDTGALIRTVS